MCQGKGMLGELLGEMPLRFRVYKLASSIAAHRLGSGQRAAPQTTSSQTLPLPGIPPLALG